MIHLDTSFLILARGAQAATPWANVVQELRQRTGMRE